MISSERTAQNTYDSIALPGSLSRWLESAA
jgi:hypothetical protein